MIYFLQRSSGDVKIGQTHHSRYHQRVRELTRQCGSLNLLGVAVGDRTAEYNLHLYFERDRVRYDGRDAEWFRFSPQLRDYVEAHSTLNVDLCATSESDLLAYRCVMRSRLRMLAEQSGHTLKSLSVSTELPLLLLVRWQDGDVGLERPAIANGVCRELGCTPELLFYYTRIRGGLEVEPNQLEYLQEKNVLCL